MERKGEYVETDMDRLCFGHKLQHRNLQNDRHLNRDHVDPPLFLAQTKRIKIVLEVK